MVSSKGRDEAASQDKAVRGLGGPYGRESCCMEDGTFPENFYQLTIVDLFFQALDVFLGLVFALMTNLLSGLFGGILG